MFARSTEFRLPLSEVMSGPARLLERTIARPLVDRPRTIGRLRIGPAAPESAADESSWKPRGAAFFDRVYGHDAQRVLGNLRAVDAEVAAWILDDAYGKVLSRPAVSASLRERVAVVLLAAQGLRNQLS